MTNSKNIINKSLVSFFCAFFLGALSFSPTIHAMAQDQDIELVQTKAATTTAVTTAPVAQAAAPGLTFGLAPLLGLGGLALFFAISTTGISIAYGLHHNDPCNTTNTTNSSEPLCFAMELITKECTEAALCYFGQVSNRTH